MREVATSLTSARAAGPDGPSIDDLLQSGTFHQRLAAARAEREKVLAARDDSAAEPQFLPGPKPWERPEYLRGEVRKTKREAPMGKALPPRAPVVVPAPKPAAEAAPVAEPVLPPVAVPSVAPLPATSGLRRSKLYQVAAGVALGVVVGAGSGFWFARTPQPAPSPVAISADVPLVSAPGTGETVLLALPSTDALPASPDLPRLIAAPNVPATLPAITGGGPVGPQMAASPAVVAPGLALAEAGAPAPVALAEPVLNRAPSAGLTGDAADPGFIGPAAPLPVSFALPRGAMPNLSAGAQAALPSLPDAMTAPAFFEMPETAAPAPGDQPLAAPGASLPVARPAPSDHPRLVVHAPATLTDAEIATASEAFAAAGFDMIEPKAVDFNIKKTNVRFFSAEDEAEAAKIAAALGADLRDFTGFSPQPPEGTIEVWLAGRGNAAPVVSAKPAKAVKALKARKARAAGPSQVQILKNRLVQQLRAGVLN